MWYFGFNPMKVHELVNGLRSWERVSKGGTPGDGICRRHMWRRATRGADLLRGRRAHAIAATPTDCRGILVGRCFVREIQAEPYPETSANEKNEPDDPNPPRHTTGTGLSFAKPRAQPLGVPLLVLFPCNHAETSPENVALFATPRNQLLLGVST